MKKYNFICHCCGLEQNLDQSVNINQEYCVSCYNKEQIHREMMKKMDKFIIFLKGKNQYTKIRRKKINVLIRLNEIISPLTIFLLEEGEVADAIDEARRKAFTKGIEAVSEKFELEIINIHAINTELIENFIPLWNYKTFPPKLKLNSIISLLKPVIDTSILSNDNEKLKNFYKELKENTIVLYFTLSDGDYIIKNQPLFEYKKNYLLKTMKSYKKKIEKVASQPAQFQYFVKFIGENCQFQTMDDRMRKSIQTYILSVNKQEIDDITNRMMNEINQTEKSELIPNIAKYIMDNSEKLFENWYTTVLPFDKSRFMVSQAKTGSRTDFIVRLQYHFRKSELKTIAKSLHDTTEILLKAKAQQKIDKIEKNSQYTEEKKAMKIEKTKVRLEENLLPENLKETQVQNVNGAPMVARLLLLNSEKAFNIVLDEIIRYHYKRLGLTTPVTYITNVLESGAIEKNKELKAFYLIQSREW